LCPLLASRFNTLAGGLPAKHPRSLALWKVLGPIGQVWDDTIGGAWGLPLILISNPSKLTLITMNVLWQEKEVPFLKERMVALSAWLNNILTEAGPTGVDDVCIA
jgi:hypothetical protein